MRTLTAKSVLFLMFDRIPGSKRRKTNGTDKVVVAGLIWEISSNYSKPVIRKTESLARRGLQRKEALILLNQDTAAAFGTKGSHLLNQMPRHVVEFAAQGAHPPTRHHCNKKVGEADDHGVGVDSVVDGTVPFLAPSACPDQR